MLFFYLKTDVGKAIWLKRIRVMVFFNLRGASATAAKSDLSLQAGKARNAISGKTQQITRIFKY